MKIRFLRDFQGVATGEVFFRAGDEVDHENWAAICAEDAAAVVLDKMTSEPVEHDTLLPEAPSVPRRGRKVGA